MKKTSVFLFLGIVMLASFGFNTVTNNRHALFSCTSPDTPTDILREIVNCPKPFQAATGVLGADGYEWAVTDGAIAAGQGTGVVTVYAYDQTITLSVRAFNNGSNSSICYSGWKSEQITFKYAVCP